MRKFGFTLMEVNLAVFIMAVGVLGMVSLYPLGFSENRQSRDDVAAAIMADGILNPLVAALSYTNIPWSVWKDLLPSGNAGRPGCLPDNGWYAYCNQTTFLPNSIDSIKSTSRSVINRLTSAYNGPGDPKGDINNVINSLNRMGFALVATTGFVQDERGEGVVDNSRICLSLRSTRRRGQLFSQPMFYTEVHFQGNPDL